MKPKHTLIFEYRTSDTKKANHKMKHSKILQLALDKHLAQTDDEAKDKTRHICFAINQTVDGRSYETISKGIEIIDHIMECLHPAAIVTNWLMDNSYIGLHPTEFELDQIQLYRKRWMLHLIEEYKKQGK